MKDIINKLKDLKNKIVEKEDDEIFFNDDFSVLPYTNLSNEQINYINRINLPRKIRTVFLYIILNLSIILIYFLGITSTTDGIIFMLGLIFLDIFILYCMIKYLKRRFDNNAKAYKGLVISKELASSGNSSWYCLTIELENKKITLKKLNKRLLNIINVGDQVLIVISGPYYIVIPSKI